MKLRTFRVTGFQSFSDSEELTFGDGFNLVVGQNNAGKSALLRAIHSLTDDRHRTVETWRDHQLDLPRTFHTIEVSGDELADAVLLVGQAAIPVDDTGRSTAIGRSLLASRKVELRLERRPGAAFSSGGYPSHGLFTKNDSNSSVAALASKSGSEIKWSTQYSTEDGLPGLAEDIWRRSMFHFNAERLSIGESLSGYAKKLLPDASNLPAVLSTLQGDQPEVFQRLIEHVRDIFPTVSGISVRPSPGSSNVQVRIWPTDARQQVELSFPLNNSGTGVSQVIAILTAVMTVENALIIIDEINSFLHPAAVKALLRVLQTGYAEHQYIISTHSPDVIASTNADTLHVVRRDGFESRVSKLDIEAVDNLRTLSDELGVSFSDVFAADRILWVEGPTEELCFPLLYQLATGHSKPRGVVISGVTATGDLTRKRDQELVHEIYQKVSSVALVAAAAASLDAELLNDEQQAEMKRKAKGRLFFLPRRHIECYLVDPEAIAAFLAAKQDGNGPSIQDVEAALIELAESPKFRQNWNGDLRDSAWLKTLDAANLILAACTKLSDARVSFNKKRDSEFLLLNLINRRSVSLEELSGYVKTVVDALEEF